MTQKINKENWKEFFDKMSRERINRETSVQILSDDTGAQYLSQGLPFVGLTFEEKPGETRIELILGSGVDNHQTHTIINPLMVAFESTGERSEGTLDIEDESGTKTLVKFTERLPAAATKMP